MDTKQIGNLTELQCITYLYKLGCKMSIPFGDSEKYDMIMDYNNKLYKVQSKHANEILDEKTGQVSFIKLNTTWQSHNTSGWSKHKYLPKDVDYFCTFYNERCYLIPLKECSTEKRLRLIPPKNGQTKGVSFLRDYEAEHILESL